MTDKQNPILNFRSPAILQEALPTFQYDVSNGLHRRGELLMINEIEGGKQSTMITETREAVDSSEMAG